MTFVDYIKHYFSISSLGLFFFVSLGIVLLIHLLLWLITKKNQNSKSANTSRSTFSLQFAQACECYYELIFSSTSILLFISIYFWMDLGYINLQTTASEIWTKYQDFLLLGFILISSLFNRIMDHLIVPLRNISTDKRNILRMMSMLYMMIIFIYIKFIYQDDNYDQILFYFLTLIIGRFVYFDASYHDFLQAMKDLKDAIPELILVLLSTALLALYGFHSGYLLRSNGVVSSLFIAHFFVIVEIFIIAKTKILEKMAAKKA